MRLDAALEAELPLDGVLEAAVLVAVAKELVEDAAGADALDLTAVLELDVALLLLLLLLLGPPDAADDDVEEERTLELVKRLDRATCELLNEEDDKILDWRFLSVKHGEVVVAARNEVNEDDVTTVV